MKTQKNLELEEPESQQGNDNEATDQIIGRNPGNPRTPIPGEQKKSTSKIRKRPKGKEIRKDRLVHQPGRS